MPTDPDQRDDQALIDAMNQGDVDAFDALYRRHREWVVALARRWTRSDDVALDVLQDTFLYFLSRFPGFELTAKLTTFLYPVVRHTAIAADQKANRQRTGFVPDEPAGDAPVRDEGGALQQAIGSLDPLHRDVLMLRFADGLSLQEIAAALEIPIGTVKSRLHNGLRHLRAHPGVAEDFFGSP